MAHAPTSFTWSSDKLSKHRNLQFYSFNPSEMISYSSDGSTFQIRSKTDNRILFSKHIKTYLQSSIPPTKFRIALSIIDNNIQFITLPGTNDDKNSDFAEWAHIKLSSSDLGQWSKIDPNTYKQDAPLADYISRNECIEKDANLKIYKFTSQRFVVANSDCGESEFYASFIYYPGWRAYDKFNNEIKIAPYENALLSVKANGDVMFVYKPASFAIGLWFFISGLIAAGIVVGKSKSPKSVS